MSKTDNLRETIGGLQKQFTENPEKAVLTYYSSSKLVEGLQSKATLRNHKLTIDLILIVLYTYLSADL